MTTPDIPPDVQPYSASDMPLGSRERDRIQRSTQTLLLLSLYATVAFASAFGVFHYDSATAYCVHSIVFAIVGTTWAINDARIRAVTFHPVLRMLHLLFCPISLVLYLVVTRGFRGLGIAALHGIAMIVVANIAFYSVFCAIYFTGYWDLYDPIYFEP
ncbi:hypothetical protein [Aporhodopirellula aestuarii]|uniref:Uncharacterized protein n=1 Tax=Aporhodopirellula aestuarii TaxID=2950107 RepID=A0ABT0U5P3_9BACT|nr:hypothetical protein [Aporhodopirellula aestuarii]MCM2372195.1 hypothetical protein [Aporhodopirellula aestuarii]